MAYPYSYDYEAEQMKKNYRPPKLATNRSMWKLMILNILTLGIYGFWLDIKMKQWITKHTHHV